MKTAQKSRVALKEALPHGAMTEIAERCGLTKYTISRVVNGQSNNIKAKRAIENYLKELRSLESSIATQSRMLAS